MKYNNEHVYNLILNNTKRLLNERGIKGWSMDRLAKESSLAKNTLYKIVGSKREAILAVVFRDMGKIRTQLEAMLNKNPESITLEEYGEVFLMTFSNLHGSYLTEIILEFPGKGPKIEAEMKEMRKLLKRLIETVKKENWLREDLDIDLLFECLRGVSMEFIRMGYTGDVFVEKSRKVYNYLLHGITYHTKIEEVKKNE